MRNVPSPSCPYLMKQSKTVTTVALLDYTNEDRGPHWNAAPGWRSCFAQLSLAWLTWTQFTWTKQHHINIKLEHRQVTSRSGDCASGPDDKKDKMKETGMFYALLVICSQTDLEKALVILQMGLKVPGPREKEVAVTGDSFCNSNTVAACGRNLLAFPDRSQLIKVPVRIRIHSYCYDLVPEPIYWSKIYHCSSSDHCF